jgi:hypothetical protein
MPRLVKRELSQNAYFTRLDRRLFHNFLRIGDTH